MVEIRTLHTTHELQLVQKLEKTIWGMEPIPIHQTITAVKNGGLMLGAFIGDEPVGVSYSFPGYTNGKSYLCSHLLGVHPDCQHKGIGRKLKEEQKEAALKLGYTMMTWTYDPLESKNAYLNLSKLGGICSTYVENCYGDMDDSLNAGLPTDRFKLEWWIDRQFIIPKCEKQFKIPWESVQEGKPKLVDVDSALSGIGDCDSVYVPVPSFFQELKQKDKLLVIDWRMKTRKIFLTLFAKGFVAVALEREQTGPVHYYKLVKQELMGVEKHEN
ncbi:GNAT family N-acetyltransferase [Siminovitchia fortis]|uniref:GNAT family N-acetyltransferase n=2 Tax=Bacillales TaxID=1385 RepID=A0A443IKR4_9BACI|nr:GNAT family N-acetyltransferase [Siminovitchia fortis]RWR05142.1 GNAT family N-acetyltransferase [Siminovitchia fortis]WHY81804.1 GNAT family N-acetyltransferase [Siminovitchia fortis]